MPDDACPSDSDLAAFVEHACAAADRMRIEAHIHGCETCRSAVGHAIGTSR